MDFKLIKGTKRFFVHIDGYVFKTHNGRDLILPISMVKGVPKVKVGNEKLNLVLLMLEYFSEYTHYDTYTFKIIDGKIPLKNITLKKFDRDKSEDEFLIFKFKCKERASSQNTRVKNLSTITHIDVLNALKRTDFKCFYCNSKITTKNFHIDHMVPLSKGGLNQFDNLAASCSACNLMKGALDIQKFLHQIKLISSNF